MIAGILILFVGCADQRVVDPIEKNDSSPIQVGKAMGGAVTELITGSGHFHRSINPVGVWRTFSIHAQKKEDGTVRGNFQVNDHGWAYAKGKVICFSIEGNQAWIGIVIEKADNPVWIGQERCLRVVDNGEGQNAASDQISHPYVSNIQEFCTSQPDWPQLWDIESGNIQINVK